MDPLTITTAVSAVIALLNYIGKARKDLEQNAEFTEEQRAELDAQIASIPTLSHWQVKD